MRYLIILTVSIFIMFPAVAHSQTTWYVDGTNTSGPWLGTQADPFQYIQDGIDTASNGDAVLVLPFTYVENIDFKGRAITVKSSDGPEVTIIDAGMPVDPDRASGACFVNQEGPDSVLEGFTITNGGGSMDTDLGPLGGGIFCSGASPTLTGNVLVKNGNKGVMYGGGICCFYASPVITGSTVTENFAESGGGISVIGSSSRIEGNHIFDNEAVSAGGGIHCDGTAPSIIGNRIEDNTSLNSGGGIWSNGHSRIENNLIRGNAALSGYGGGGIVCFGTSGAPELVGNFIADNFAAGMGGGISCGAGSALIADNLILCNTAGGKGGGIYGTDALPLVVNDTVFGNTAEKGGAIQLASASDATVVNTIVWGNNSIAGPHIRVGGTSKMEIRYCDYDGTFYVAPSAQLNTGPGMIHSDPLFVDAANGDFHLTYSSPCKDTGDNTAVTELTDFEDDPRIAYGTVDMGADEFYTHLYYTGDAMPGGNVQLKFVGLPGTTPVGLCIGTGVLDPPIPSMWGDWYLQFPIIGPIDLGTIPSPDGVMVIPGTIPGTPPGPCMLHSPFFPGASLFR